MRLCNSVILCFILFCSCSTYYGSTMSTKDLYTVKSEQGEFMVENDSLAVIYNFRGENAPIKVSVVNKMAKPIYINWRQSGIMVNDIPSFYEDPDTKQINDYAVVNFATFLNDPDGLEYIKPYSRLNKQILELTNFYFDQIGDTLYMKWHTEADSRGKNKKYNAIRYIESNSPIYLRTFITLYEDSKRAGEAIYYENNFYMSELIKVQGSLNKIEAYKNQRGDFFYVKQVSEKKPKKGKKEKKSPSVLEKVANITGKILLWAIEGSQGHEIEIAP